MITLLGSSDRYCDGLSRRSFLQIGGLALGGLTLPTLLRCEAANAKPRAHKSVIMVYLSGGLAHQDTFDLKPNAPGEVRGEFKPITTNVPGIQICELLPKLSRCMDKMTLVRSITGLADEHSSWQNMTGVGMNTAKREGKPHMGSVVAKRSGAGRSVGATLRRSLSNHAAQAVQQPARGQPGPICRGRQGGWRRNRRDEEPGRADGSAQRSPGASCVAGCRSPKFGESADRNGGMDTFHEKAFDVLTTSKLVDALDVTKEPVSCARSVWSRLHQTSRRWGTDVERSTLDGTPIGGGGHARGDGGLRLLGHARRQLPAPEATPALVRSPASRP